MSGHEKFYIPHDDLVSLEAAIESLETTMDTLDASINTLNKNILVLTARDESSLDLHRITTAVDDIDLMHNVKLSTTYDAFLRSCVCVFSHATGSPLLTFDSGAIIAIQATGGSKYLYESIFPGNRKPSCVSTDEGWIYATSFPLNITRHPADTVLEVIMTTQNVRISTDVKVFVKYILATF